MAKSKGNTRKTGLEQCYTPVSVAAELVSVMVDELGIPLTRDWLEPAAGTGNFVTALAARGATSCLAIDIDPQAPGIAKQDFLTSTLSLSDAVCLTNPPFGRNHALSVPFFNHSAKYCEYIAFIVPRSWRKWSIVNRLDRRFHKIYDADLETSYVDKDGNPLTDSTELNTIFQVWQRRDEERELFPGPLTKHFEVVKPNEANGSLTVFGRGCGTLKTTFAPVPNTTQMFIKASDEVLRALAQVDLSEFFTQVAYTEALSRVEIDYALTNWLANKTQLPAGFLRASTLS